MIQTCTYLYSTNYSQHVRQARSLSQFFHMKSISHITAELHVKTALLTVIYWFACYCCCRIMHVMQNDHKYPWEEIPKGKLKKVFQWLQSRTPSIKRKEIQRIYFMQTCEVQTVLFVDTICSCFLYCIMKLSGVSCTHVHSQIIITPLLFSANISCVKMDGKVFCNFDVLRFAERR